MKIISQDGRFLIDSRDVAVMTEKPHNDLMKSIRSYIEHLTKGNFSRSEFFIDSNYQDGSGRTLPCFLLTRKGCDMVANKMTGEKGVLFTAAYVTKFEEMERSTNPYLALSKEMQAILLLDKRSQEVELRVEHLENSTTIDYGKQQELKKLGSSRIISLLGGKKSAAYKDSSLRSCAYSALWNDYQEFFNTNSYCNTFTKDFDRAIQYVPRWTPPNNLLRDIEQANGQIEF